MNAKTNDHHLLKLADRFDQAVLDVAQKARERRKLGLPAEEVPNDKIDTDFLASLLL